MRQITIEQFSQKPQLSMQEAQNEHILVTQNGKPLAVIMRLEYKDEEDWQLEMSPDFWRMIEERRKCATIPLKEAEKILFDD